MPWVGNELNGAMIFWVWMVWGGLDFHMYATLPRLHSSVPPRLVGNGLTCQHSLHPALPATIFLPPRSDSRKTLDSRPKPLSKHVKTCQNMSNPLHESLVLQ